MRNLNKVDEVVAEEAELGKDSAIAKEYQAFSSEILRLALLGLTAYGFVVGVVGNTAVPNLAAGGKPGGSSLTKLQYALGHVSGLHLVAKSSLICFGLAALFALAHRYSSVDSLTHMVRRCRLKRKVLELRELEAQLAVGLAPSNQYADEDAYIEGKGDGVNWNKLTLVEKKQLMLEFVRTERKSMYRDFLICKISLLLSVLLLGLGAVGVAILLALSF